MTDKDQALRLLEQAVASVAEADQSLGKLRKDDGAIENLAGKKAAVRQPLESARAKLEEVEPVLGRLAEAEKPAPGPTPPVTVPGPAEPIDAADREAVSRLRRGEQLQLVRLADGEWRVDFRTPANLPVLGQAAAAIHLALGDVEGHADFPQLPAGDEALPDTDVDALKRLAVLGAGFECALRWEANGTHSDHNFHGPEKRQHWAGERGLIVEPIEWLELELAQEPLRPERGPETPESERQAVARVFALKKAQLQRPASKKGIKWAVLGPRSENDGGETHGHGDTVAAAIAEYERKTGDRVSETATPLAPADAQALDWYAAMSSVRGSTSIRKDHSGGWHGEYWRPETQSRHQSLGKSAGIAGVVEYFKSEGL